MATILGIPPHLIRGTGKDGEHDGELCRSYLKYQVALQAVATLARKVKDGDWQGKKPAELEVVDLVISRSIWYSHYKRLFPKVSQNYPDMLEWLKESVNAPADMEIWGKEKGVYTYSDLVEWLEEKEKSGKGKGKKDKGNNAKNTTKEDEGKKTKKKRRN